MSRMGSRVSTLSAPARLLTRSGLLAEKTKGNLTSTEQNFLAERALRLRMAYLEVTNALARGPRPGAPGGPASVGSGPLVR